MPNRPDASFRTIQQDPVMSAPRSLGGVPAYSVVATPESVEPPPIDDDRDYAGNTPNEKASYADGVANGEVVGWQLPDLTFPVPAGDIVLNIFGTYRTRRDFVDDSNEGYNVFPLYKSFVDVSLVQEEEEIWNWKARLLVETYQPRIFRTTSGGTDSWPGIFSFVTHDEWFHLPPLAEEAICTITFWLVSDAGLGGPTSGEDIQRSHMCVLVTDTNPNAVPSNGALFYDNDGVFSQNPPDVAFVPFQ